jgi:hypothetical protein
MRILSKIKAWFLGVGAFLALIISTVFVSRNAGYNSRKAEEKSNALDSLEKGREHLRDGRELDPDERLRRNDGDW